MPVHVLRRSIFFAGGNRRVAVYRVPHQTDAVLHRHDFCEIVVILSGTGLHVTGGFRREIAPGDVLVINRRRAHGYERTKSLNLVNVLMNEAVLGRIGRELRDVPGFHALFNTRAERWKRPNETDRLRLGTQDLAQVEEWIARLESETRSNAPGNGLIAEAYLTLIVAAVARRYREENVPVKRAATRGVGTVVSWIGKNLAQPIRVSELARLAGMSERAFYRAFRDTMGSAPVEYVLRARLLRAEELLQERGERRISEIANACGFADSNYFSACFRKRKGCAPRQFAAGKGTAQRPGRRSF